jgi:hypothetical protein
MRNPELGQGRTGYGTLASPRILTFRINLAFGGRGFESPLWPLKPNISRHPAVTAPHSLRHACGINRIDLDHRCLLNYLQLFCGKMLVQFLEDLICRENTTLRLEMGSVLTCLLSNCSVLFWTPSNYPFHRGRITSITRKAGHH